MATKKFRLISILLISIFICSFIAAASSSSTISSSPDNDVRSCSYWPENEWRTSTPEEQGMDSQKLYEMMNYIKEKKLDIHNILIIRNGYQIAEVNFYPNKKDNIHILYSATKSVTSALIGIAIGEGHIKSVEQPVLDYFGDMNIQNVDENKRKLNIENLLTMSTSLNWTEGTNYGAASDPTTQMLKSENDVKYVLDKPMRDKPGKSFYYCTGSSQVLSAIIQRAAGKSTYDYAKEKLFKPMGIKEHYWESSKSGVNWGGLGLYLKPSDMAKFGYLYLNGGMWTDKQIVPQKWVAESTKKRFDVPSISILRNWGYGYQWWIYQQGYYSAVGLGGQCIFVYPKKKLVAVFTSSLTGLDFYAPEGLMRDYIIPSTTSAQAIPPSSARAKLEAAIGLAAQPPKAVPQAQLPPIAGDIAGKRMKMDSGQDFAITFKNPNEAVLTKYTKQGDISMDIGLDNVYRINSLGKYGPFPEDNQAALLGSWRFGKALVVSFKGLADADELQYKYIFENGKVTVTTFSKLYGRVIEEDHGKY